MLFPESTPEPGLDELLRCLSVAPPEFNSTDAAAIAAEDFGFVGEAAALGGERDQNFLLSGADGRRVLKIGNRADSAELIDLQCTVLRRLASMAPALPVPRLFESNTSAAWVEVLDDQERPHRARLLSYLPGRLVGDAPDDPRMMHALGAVTAKIGVGLRGLFHRAADHPLAWDIKRAGRIGELASGIADDRHRALAESAFAAFDRTVAPQLQRLRAQVIHNDVSFHNALVDADRPWNVAGVYDFGDVIHAPLVQDLAVAAAEIPSGRKGELALGARIVAGFHSVTPLEPLEIELLPVLAATRLAMYFAIESWKPFPDERDHFDNSEEDLANSLEAMQAAGHEEVAHLYRSACGLSPSAVTVPAETATTTLQRRRVARLGSGYELSYETPVHTVRGEGVWLYDADETAYLDCYNNVPQVGHCHPSVVRAIARQAATLNTNTRYLYEHIVEFGDRLVGTLPDELEVCMLVSSGSEANDLAWRIAATCTGHSGALVTRNAYHGVTQITHDLSPSDRDDDLAAYVETIEPPDDYRGRWRRDDQDRGAKFAAGADTAIAKLRDKGHDPAMFLFDTVLSSDGIFNIPAGFLSGVFERVRAAGGLCVADEVQAGFGRTGAHMWGFEVDGVVPDIVTFGKPIGNGHPVGAVVTRRELAEEFQATSGFFSTTGGNPVSCAAATAVLEVIEVEELQKNAQRVGAELRTALEELSHRHTVIGDVRGAGLFIGVELVLDRSTREPAPVEAHRAVNQLRQRGVLVGREGPYGNVLKIRPPIVFASSHAERLVATLDAVLDSMA